MTSNLSWNSSIWLLDNFFEVYNEIFEDIFEKYTKSHDLIKVKTINLGSMFKVYYQITLLDIKKEKEMIDEIRCRNGNLEISIQRVDYQKSEL